MEFPKHCQGITPSDQLDTSTKGIGNVADLKTGPWNLLAEDISLPAAVLYQSRLENNLLWMQRFSDINGVGLAPHGKTTMTPDFFRQQINAGAWGITLATAVQVAAAAKQGIGKILMANQLVGKRNMAIIAGLPQETEFYCLVDSVENVHQLGAFFADADKTLNVLIELGVEGGRCGCRTNQEAIALARVINEWPQLKLVGVEVYEGTIHGENAESKVINFLHWAVAVTQELVELGAFSREQVILTGAGSAWYDLVSNLFYQASLSLNLSILIRPGCYLIHDQGIYAQAQRNIDVRLRGRVGSTDGDRHTPGALQSSLEIWAYVQSLPEPGRAIIGMGKRDVAFSDGLPEPCLHFRPGNSQPIQADPAWETLELMDQHTYLKIPASADIKVGDMLSFSTSHPCLTFDKWRYVCVIDDNYQVVKLVETCF